MVSEASQSIPASIPAPIAYRKRREPADEPRSLVDRARRGDRQAFAALYRSFHAPVLRLARFHVGPDAEEVVAETFVRAWAALPRFRDTGAPFVSWLYGIARHVVQDELARRRRIQPWAEPPQGNREWQEDDRLALERAVAQLPEAERWVIELKFLAGLRNPEIAAALGISTSAVNSRQWRGLRTLRGSLAET